MMMEGLVIASIDAPIGEAPASLVPHALITGKPGRRPAGGATHSNAGVQPIDLICSSEI